MKDYLLTYHSACKMTGVSIYDRGHTQASLMSSFFLTAIFRRKGDMCRPRRQRLLERLTYFPLISLKLAELRNNLQLGLRKGFFSLMSVRSDQF